MVSGQLRHGAVGPPLVFHTYQLPAGSDMAAPRAASTETAVPANELGQVVGEVSPESFCSTAHRLPPAVVLFSVRVEPSQASSSLSPPTRAWAAGPGEQAKVDPTAKKSYE